MKFYPVSLSSIRILRSESIPSHEYLKFIPHCQLFQTTLEHAYLLTFIHDGDRFDTYTMMMTIIMTKRRHHAAMKREREPSTYLYVCTLPSTWYLLVPRPTYTYSQRYILYKVPCKEEGHMAGGNSRPPTLLEKKKKVRRRARARLRLFYGRLIVRVSMQQPSTSRKAMLPNQQVRWLQLVALYCWLADKNTYTPCVPIYPYLLHISMLKEYVCIGQPHRYSAAVECNERIKAWL